jgi:DNA-binding Lrp family transcriptional regulator
MYLEAMPKSSLKQIEQDEKKILDELVKNAHNSINEIANKLGFSRQKVWKVVKNLEENKTIWGYTAIIDNEKIGQKRFCILLKKAHVKATDEKLNIVINREMRNVAMKNGVNLESTYFFNGVYDGQICVTAENILQVKNFVSDLYEKIGASFIKEAEILEVLFPIQVNGFDNPAIKKFKDYFQVK